MKYNSELHGQFPYFSGCGMTFVLIIAGTLVPGMPSATIAHPMAAKFHGLCVSIQFYYNGKDGTIEVKLGLTVLVCPDVNLSLEVLTEPVFLKHQRNSDLTAVMGAIFNMRIYDYHVPGGGFSDDTR